MGEVRYYSTTSAAKALELSRAFVSKQCKDGTLRALNLAEPGKRPRYRIAEADLHEFMERYRVGAA